MGGCLSTPAADAAGTTSGKAGHMQQRNGAVTASRSSSKGQGRCAHDSVCSVEEGDTDAVQDRSRGNSSSSRQQRRAARQQQPRSNGSSGGNKGRRPVAIDMATGQRIPDFSVAGHFDVLHELGSGGSGVTYLCRDLATHQVRCVIAARVLVWCARRRA